MRSDGGSQEAGRVEPATVQCPDRVKELVERFEQNRDAYRSLGHNDS